LPGFVSLSLASAAAIKVVSLNLCTDELLLALAAPQQIVSVTHLSQQPQESAYWRRARRYRQNDGSLLSVVSMKPDLVLTMGGGVRDHARIASRLGIRVLDLPYPQSLGDIERSMATVAAALGRRSTGQQWLGRMQALQTFQPKRAADTIWLGGGGRSVAATGLAAQWMALAGFKQRPLNGDRVSLEQLLAKPPAILLRSDYRVGEYSGEQRWLKHPLAKGTKRSRMIVTDGRAWTCMGPAMIREVVRLRGQLGR
jgi:iron complex transport system substrate-binding protein